MAMSYQDALKQGSSPSAPRRDAGLQALQKASKPRHLPSLPMFPCLPSLPMFLLRPYFLPSSSLQSYSPPHNYVPAQSLQTYNGSKGSTAAPLPPHLCSHQGEKTGGAHIPGQPSLVQTNSVDNQRGEEKLTALTEQAAGKDKFSQIGQAPH